MPEDTQESKEPLVLLSSLPLDNSAGAEEEKIDSLWQMMVYQAFQNDLSEAKNRRADAERVREQVEHERNQVSQALSQQMRDEAARELTEAREQRHQAAQASQEAQDEWARAKEALAQAKKESDQTLEDARKQAQEITDSAREKAQGEITELRRQALKEIKSVLGRVESMRATANEEMETQRILSNVAKLKATTQWTATPEDYTGQEGEAPHEEDATAQPVTAATQASPSTSTTETAQSSAKTPPKRGASTDKS